MQNVISLQKAKEMKDEQTYKKAMLLAQMHVFMNDAEKNRKELYAKYSEALMAGDTNAMFALALSITEAGGMLRAFTKSANYIASNV